jgi:hypothetical protein
LRKTEERQSRFRSVAGLVRLAVARLGVGVLATESLQLAELIMGRTECVPGDRAGQVVARLLRGRCRFGPSPLQLHELASMDQAVPAIGDEVGLGVAPAGQCGRPLPGPLQIEEFRTAGDHRAVGDSGIHPGHLAGGDADHTLVQQGHAGGTLALQEQTHALAEA